MTSMESLYTHSHYLSSPCSYYPPLYSLLHVLQPGDFIGKEALHKIKSDGLKRKLCFLTVSGNTDVDPEGDETVWLDDKVWSYLITRSHKFTDWCTTLIM